MANLKIGYNIFEGSSQAGTDSSVPGTLIAETSQKGKHKVRVQRLSDNQYWDWVAEAWQVAATVEAEDGDFVGSFTDSGRATYAAVRRLSMRLPQDVLDGLTAAGVKIWVYKTGDTPSEYIQMAFAL